MEVGEVGEGGRLYTYRYTVTIQNDSCIKMGSNDSRFNVSLTVMDKATRQCPQTTLLKRGEPKRNRAEALLLTSLTPNRWAKPAHPSTQ